MLAFRHFDKIIDITKRLEDDNHVLIIVFFYVFNYTEKSLLFKEMNTWLTQ